MSSGPSLVFGKKVFRVSDHTDSDGIPVFKAEGSDKLPEIAVCHLHPQLQLLRLDPSRGSGEAIHERILRVMYIPPFV